VTALYEIVPAGVEIETATVDPLTYQRPASATVSAARDELMTVKLRYKAPDGAEFGMVLRQSEHRGSSTLQDAAALARRFRGADPDGYRAEFVRLVELAGSLPRQSTEAR
jgi:Ca-activated chloride channel family protein